MKLGARKMLLCYIVLWLYIASTILFSQKLIYIIVYFVFSDEQ